MRRKIEDTVPPNQGFEVRCPPTKGLEFTTKATLIESFLERDTLDEVRISLVVRRHAMPRRIVGVLITALVRRRLLSVINIMLVQERAYVFFLFEAH